MALTLRAASRAAGFQGVHHLTWLPSGFTNLVGSHLAQQNLQGKGTAYREDF